MRKSINSSGQRGERLELVLGSHGRGRSKTGGPSVDLAESQVDSGGGDFLGFGDLMVPVFLGGSSHDEEAAVLEEDGDFFATFFVAEVEASFGSEADGGDVGFGVEFFLVVAVPAHALVAVGVEIEEAGVVVGIGGGFDGFFDGEEFWSPDFGGVGVAGIAVIEVAVAIPGHLACGDDAFAEHHGFVVLPGDVLEKRLEMGVGGLGGEDGAVVGGLSVLGEDWVRWRVLGGVEIELELVGVAHRGLAFLTDRWGELKTRGPFGWLLFFVLGGVC